MKYLFNRRWLSLRTDFAIADETGAERYRVVSAMISLGDRLTLRRADGSTAAVVAQKLISWRPRYEIERPGGPGATLLAQGWFWRSFLLDGDRARYRVRGGFWRRRWRFIRDGKRVATATLPFFSLRRRCSLDIAEGEDDEMILAGWVAILKVLDRQKAESASGSPGDAGGS